MRTGGQLGVIPEPGKVSRGETAPTDTAAMTAESIAVWTETRSPQEICARYGSDFVPPAPLDKIAVALNTLNLVPLNARRVLPESGNCGWYIWGGKGGKGGDGGNGRESGDSGGRARPPGFFQTLPVARLLERCPQVMPFLALAPGWRVRLAVNAPEIMPPHDVEPPANVAARRIGARASPPPPVNQWVWLSILLHILAIVLFGDTTGGGVRSGDHRDEPRLVRGGPFNVTLQVPADGVAGAPPALRTDSRLSSLERRERGGRGARVAPSTPPSPPTTDDAPAIRNLPSQSSPKLTGETTPTAVMPPMISTEVEKPVTNFVVPVVTSEPIVPPMQSEPVAVRRLESLPRLDAIVPAEAIGQPKIERAVALPTELIPRLAPLAPTRTERETIAPVEAAPRLKTFVPPPIDSIASVAEVPPVEITRMAPLTPPQVERKILRPAEMLPRLTPVAPAPVMDASTPTTLVPRVVAPVPVGVNQVTEPAGGPASGVSGASSVSATPVIPSASRSAPDVLKGAGTTAGEGGLAPRDAAAIAGPALSTGRPRIDLDAVRQRAREIDREGSGPRTLLPFNVKPKEEIKTKVQQAFDKALKRPDCRDAYAGMGLAAVVPLLWDAVSEKGCKW